MRRTLHTLAAILIIGCLQGSSANITGQTVGADARDSTRLVELRRSVRKLQNQVKNARAEVSALRDSVAAKSMLYDSAEAVNRFTMESLAAKTTTLENQIAEASTDSGDTMQWASLGVVALLLMILLARIKTGGARNVDEQTEIDNVNQRAIEAASEENKGLERRVATIEDSVAQLIERGLVQATSRQDPDHSFALMMAEHVNTLQKNLLHMDVSTKGHRQLTGAVARIMEVFAEHEYEIVNLYGRKYNPGMNISAEFVIDETLESGAQIISSVMKPQVNFRGVVIQTAEVIVKEN